jgi:hypothetical protein
MTFLFGVVVGGLAMWRWRDVVREGVSKAFEQLARGSSHLGGAAGVKAMDQEAGPAPRGSATLAGAVESEARYSPEAVQAPASRPIGLIT